MKSDVLFRTESIQSLIGFIIVKLDWVSSTAVCVALNYKWINHGKFLDTTHEIFKHKMHRRIFQGKGGLCNSLSEPFIDVINANTIFPATCSQQKLGSEI